MSILDVALLSTILTVAHMLLASWLALKSEPSESRGLFGTSPSPFAPSALTGTEGCFRMQALKVA